MKAISKFLEMAEIFLIKDVNIDGSAAVEAAFGVGVVVQVHVNGTLHQTNTGVSSDGITINKAAV